MLDSCSLWDSTPRVLNSTKTCLYCVYRGWCQLAVLSPYKLTLGGSVFLLLALPDHVSFDLCSSVEHLFVCAMAEYSPFCSLSEGPKMSFFTTVGYHIDTHWAHTQTGHQCICMCVRGIWNGCGPEGNNSTFHGSVFLQEM